MTLYNIYFQNPISKELVFMESIESADNFAAQLYAVRKYKTHPDWQVLKPTLRICRANKED